MESPELSGNPLIGLGLFPPFDRVEAAHVAPGMGAVLAECEKRLVALEAHAEQVTFQELANEVEYIGDLSERAWGTLSHLKSVRDSEALRTAYLAFQPKMVEFNLRMGQSLALYNAWKRLQGLPELSESERRVVDLQVIDAELNGVSLAGEAKEKFNQVQTELEQLRSRFANNVLDATKAWTLVVTDKSELAGLPASALALTAQQARSEVPSATAENGPWKLTLDLPCYMPVMRFAEKRELREMVYKAYLTRASELGVSKDHDNGPLISRIVELRQEKAKLLGYSNFAQVSCAKKMATVESALELMEDLRSKAMPAAVKEHKELCEFVATELGFTEQLQQWDVTYFAEKLQENKYAFNDEDLKPYFSLPVVLQGLFSLVNRLFGVQISEVSEQERAELAVSTWNETVSIFKVSRDGQLVAYYYFDPYSRPSEKKGGAWMNSVAGRTSNPLLRNRVPVAHVICNQSAPVDGKPSLMTLQEVITLFHEHGHALQHMLTQEENGLVAGIRGIEWDAVELPSQFMENFVYDRATLDTIAKHVDTGALLPEDLYLKMKAAMTFRAATQMARQLTFSLVDLAIHADGDVRKTYSEHMQEVSVRTTVIPPQPYDRFLCGFAHIMSGGYAAGYFSYKWAEVLSADAFGAFEEAGLDNENRVVDLGRRFASTVLGLGGGTAPSKVFEAFRGRQPTVDALLRQSGLA